MTPADGCGTRPSRTAHRIGRCKCVTLQVKRWQPEGETGIAGVYESAGGPLLLATVTPVVVA